MTWVVGVKDSFTPPPPFFFLAFSIVPASLLLLPTQAKRASEAESTGAPTQRSGCIRGQVTPGPEAREINVCLPTPRVSFLGMFWNRAQPRDRGGVDDGWRCGAC